MMEEAGSGAGGILGAILAWMDPVVILIYFGGITLAGLYFARKNKTTEEYFLGNRSFPGWAIGLSLVGTSISSLSFLGIPADSFKTAWLRFLVGISMPLVVLMGAYVFLPFYRRGRVTSAFEYLEARFGPSTRLYGAIAFLISQLVRISMVLFLLSLVLHELVGWDKWVCVVVSGVFVSFYTVAGGIEAVVWTDVAQTIILSVGGLLCLIKVVILLPGGLGEVVSTATHEGKFQFAEYKEWRDLNKDFAAGRRWEGTGLITIVESTENDGTYEWTIPDDIAPGDDYMIRVSSPDGGVEDVSNVNFTVASEPTNGVSHVLSPCWGEAWLRGSPETIRWRPEFADASAVRIDLFRGDKLERTIAENALNSGAYQWSIPDDLELGSDFRVAVSAASDPEVQSFGATYFAIVDDLATRALTIRYPNGGESWRPGSTHAIAWRSTAEDVPSVRIEAVKGRGLHPIPKGFSLIDKTVLMMLFVGLTHFMAEYACNQNVVQRYCASASAREARKAMLICCIASLVIWTFFRFLGTSLYVFFQRFPSPETTAMLTGSAKPEKVLPYFITHFLPAGVSGLVLAAVLAAAMSSLDSSLNAISTVSIVDIYRRHLVKGRDDTHYLLAARLVAVGASVFMIAGGWVLAYAPTKTIGDTGTALSAILAGGLLGLYLLGFLTTKGDARAVIVAIAVTVLWSLYMTLVGYGLLPESLRLPVDVYYTGVIGHIVMFAIGFVMGLLLPTRKRDLTNLSVWTQDGTPLD